MTQLQFEALSLDQQLYQWLLAIDAATTVSQLKFESLSTDIQLFYIYEALGGTQAQLFFERMTRGQQLWAIYTEIGGIDIGQRFFEKLDFGLQLWYIHNEGVDPIDRDYFLSLTRGQQLWYVSGSAGGGVAGEPVALDMLFLPRSGSAGDAVTVANVNADTEGAAPGAWALGPNRTRNLCLKVGSGGPGSVGFVWSCNGQTYDPSTQTKHSVFDQDAVESAAKTISGMTTGAPGVAVFTTSAAHGLSTGDHIRIRDVSGGAFTAEGEPVNINNQTVLVTVTSSTQFTISGFTVGTAGTGGTIRASYDTMSWTPDVTAPDAVTLVALVSFGMVGSEDFDCAIDHFVLYGSAFGVPQEKSVSGETPIFWAHGQEGGSSTFASGGTVPRDTPLLMTMQEDVAGEKMKILFQDPATFEMVGYVETVSEFINGFASLVWQNYLIFYTGKTRHYGFGLDFSASFPIAPVVLTTPELGSTQTAALEITVTREAIAWGSTCNLEERVNGGAWTEIDADWGETSKVLGSRTDGATYEHRSKATWNGNESSYGATDPLAVDADLFPSCNTLHETDGSGSTIDDRTLGTGNAFFVGSKFVADSTSGRCRAELRLKTNGSPTGSYRVQVWSHDSGTDLPNAAIGTATSEVDVSMVGGSYAMVNFENLVVSLTSGTTYWLVCTKSTGSADNVNHLYWDGGEVDSAGGNKIAIKNAFGGGWSDGGIADIMLGKFNLYGSA